MLTASVSRHWRWVIRGECRVHDLLAGHCGPHHLVAGVQRRRLLLLCLLINLLFRSDR